MRHSSVGPDHRPIEVGRLQTVAEHDHLSGRRVDLRMRTHAKRQRSAEVVATDGHQLRRHLVGSDALAQGEEHVRVPDDVDVGEHLVPTGVRIGAGKRGGRCRRRHDPAPQGAAGFHLGRETLGEHVAVSIARLAIREAHTVDHAVAVERIGIAPERREFGVGAVAQIDAAQVVGNAPHDAENVRVCLHSCRAPRSGVTAGS
jgi:hypothetical protein